MGETFEFHEGTLVGVHPAGQCAGEWCVIHNPLPTYPRDRLHWRSDRKIFEVICKHGVGHPAPEQHLFWKALGQEWQSVHGCDYCCAYWLPNAISDYVEHDG